MTSVYEHSQSTKEALILSSFLDKSMDDVLSEGNTENIYMRFHSNLNVLFRSYSSKGLKAQFYEECIAHPIFEVFAKEPITSRSCNRPRGYAGDAELIDFIYRLKSPDPKTSFIGRELYSNILESSVCKSVRWRAKHLAEKIEESYQNKKTPLNVFAIACGHLRELHFVDDLASKISNFYALDQDPLSIEEARRSLSEIKIDFIADSILSLIKRSVKINQPLDFIYSAGLFDYLNHKLARKLLTATFDLLAPGGSMLIANFAPGLTEQAYMEAFMDWHLIYRNESEMEALLKEIPHTEIDSIKMYRDPMGNVVYMELSRKK